MAVNINSGDLRHFITLRRPTQAQNDEGGNETTYVDFMTVRAAVKETSQQRGDLPAVLLHTKDFIIRFTEERAAINKDYLVVYDGNAYTIQAIEKVQELKTWLKITGKAKTNG